MDPRSLAERVTVTPAAGPVDEGAQHAPLVAARCAQVHQPSIPVPRGLRGTAPLPDARSRILLDLTSISRPSTAVTITATRTVPIREWAGASRNGHINHE
jgi:hypothetical protein